MFYNGVTQTLVLSDSLHCLLCVSLLQWDVYRTGNSHFAWGYLNTKAPFHGSILLVSQYVHYSQILYTVKSINCSNSRGEKG
jgi:hypothetical protein